MEDCLEHLERRVTAEMNSELVQLFTEMEVCTALHQMVPQKAPGPVGFDAHFFQKKLANCWTRGLQSCSFVFEFRYHE